ncbi:MAG: hypothetical protein WA366_10745 [Pseudolabrys sp.]
MNRVSQTKTLTTFLVAALSVAASVSGAAATTVINSNASGFYQNTGGTPSLGSTNIIEDSTRNNYFAFDLSGVSGTVTGAKLTIFGPNGLFLFNSTTPATVTYSIYDVTTNIGALTGHTAGAAAFTDLGSGLVYGSTSFAATTGSSPQLVIDLAGGLNDINAALGGLFALGGDSSLVSNQGFLWSSSFLGPAAQLTLETTPLPAALPLFATVLGGGGLVAWRRRRLRRNTGRLVCPLNTN